MRTQNQPTVSNRFECLMCWMSEEPLSPRRRYLVKHTTRTAMVGGVDVRYRIDVETLRRDESATHARAERPRARAPAAERAARVRLLPAQPRHRQPDRDRRGDQRNGRRRRDPRHRGRGRERPREERAQPERPLAGHAHDPRAPLEALGHAGATLWFTGLPGAGKSTVAAAVEERLIEAGQPAFLLDGDNLRHGLNGDLGFDESARSENVRRTAHVARLLAESGTIALVSLVSPYAADREAAAPLHAADDLAFLEIFVDAPLELCEQRDPKGLYARARAGELAGLTGVGAPYEAPPNPTSSRRSEETVEEEVERVMELLTARGLISLDELSATYAMPGAALARSAARDYLFLLFFL